MTQTHGLLLSVRGLPGRCCPLPYENPRSVAINADRIKSAGWLAQKFWEWAADDNNQLATEQLADSMYIKR
ncbi:hypothetical protein KCP74_19780 [Salmonella enterica subsp. enterica]|nr:hypothetical protein KCP74_19780 [Salmonella enterica subsp. enterica]